MGAAEKLSFSRLNPKKHRQKVWDAFRGEGLLGINDDDCAIFPRVLPKSYLPTIEATAFEITTFVLRLLTLPEREVLAIIPRGPIRDFLVDELGVLKHRRPRLTGSFRFDMAIVGEPVAGNPPKLLEINEIGFDGLHRSSMVQKVFMRLLPQLADSCVALDTSRAEVRNMLRLGPNLARMQYDLYNWEEEVLVRTGRAEGLQVDLVTPSDFGCGEDREFPLIRERQIGIRDGRLALFEATGKSKQGRGRLVSRPDAVQMGFSFELSDYQEAVSLYANVVRSQTPMYGSFLSGLVASKAILVLLDDPILRHKILGTSRQLQNAILPAAPLWGNEANVLDDPKSVVLKHVDGMGGELVFFDQEIPRRMKKIPLHEAGHWIVQQRIPLNTIGVTGILSGPRRVIADLGVFVQYDWAGGRFRNFEVGGFISRATNKSYRVNVSGGGIQVPVFFSKDD